jgi:hypothetical protein
VESKRLRVTPVPLISPVIVAVLRYAQKCGAPVAVMLPESMALLEAVLAPWVSVPVTLKVSVVLFETPTRVP